MPKIINVVGARPNFMKIAPLCHAFADYPQLESLLVHTGQHYDEKLSTIFFEDLGIPRPDIDLGVGSGTREQQIERIKAAFEPMVLDLRPDAVLVVGDVNSTIACAEVARRHGVKIIHVEAGLRSYDLDMPEEHNRVETDRISDLLFVTEASGMDNLEREAIAGAKYLVGNVMIDTLVANFDKARGSAVLEQLSLTPGDYFVATFHRPSNVDERENLTRLVETIEEICRRAHLVLPLHPRTEKSLDRHELRRRLDRLRELTLCEPLGYLDFLCLVSRSKAVVTDSGGIQEETTYLGIPCLTMRGNTERPSTMDIGTNTLVGSDRGKLMQALDEIIEGRYKKGRVPPLWDGRAAGRIADIIVTTLIRRPLS